MSEQKFSRGVEKVILLAALDEEFCEKLLTDRAAALDSCGAELTAIERGVLEGIPAGQLEEAIRNAKVPEPARKAFLRGVAAAVILGSVLGATSCSDDYTTTLGIRPDREHVERTQEEKPGEDAPSDK